MTSRFRAVALLSGASLFGASALYGAVVAPVAPPPPPPAASGDIEWPSYNRTLDGQRFSTLDQINADNVESLVPICNVKIADSGSFSSGLLMIARTIYATSGRVTVAIDARDCSVIWKAVTQSRGKEPFPFNRGLAYGDGLVVRGTGDGRLIAFDAKTGEVRWDRTVGNPAIGEGISAAPIVWNRKIFVGLSGGDYGIQGKMMAFDLATGDRLWSFNTVPHPGEAGNETWPGESWKLGGGATWTSYALDEKTGELFIPVANPAPDLNAAVRRGDNLYTNSIVALDANTGKHIWHYQTRKNDNHDYGVTPPAVLVSLRNGRQIISQAAKDGFVYGVDRKSHKLLYKTPVTTILNHDADATPEGIKICPGLLGGVEYNSAAFDSRNQVLVSGAADWCFEIASAPLTYVPGEFYMGGTYKSLGTGSGWVTALDAATGGVRWQFATPAPVLSGVTPTAGNVTFVGDMAGNLYVVRSTDGKILQTLKPGGAIAGGVITYAVAGTQYIATTAGNLSRSTWPMATGAPSIVIYGLRDRNSTASGMSEGGVHAKQEAAVPPAPARVRDLTNGQALFAANCSGCHGSSGEGGVGPNLKSEAARRSQADLVAFLKNPPPRMPAVYPSPLNEADLNDVAEFVLSLK